MVDGARRRWRAWAILSKAAVPDLVTELARTEGDLAVAVQEATTAREASIAANDVLRYLTDAVAPEIWDDGEPMTTTTHRLHEAVVALKKRADDEHATNAELRRQLAGTGALLGTVEGRLRAIRDLCNAEKDILGLHTVSISEVLAALGAVGTEE